jgi:outer membrane protein TolC
VVIVLHRKIMSALLNLNWRWGKAGWLLAVVLLIFASGAWAGPASAGAGDNRNSTLSPTNNPAPWLPSGPLTVEQALQRALDSDAQIASLKAALEIARQQRLAATDIKDPVLQAQSRSSHASESVSSGELDNSRLGVGVYVPNPWLMVPGVDARTADYQAAQADLSNATWQVNCDVRRLFAQLDYLTNDLAFTVDRLRLNGEVLNALQARVGQGAATVSDLMTASRQYVQSQDDFDQINHHYQLARRQLASLLDIPPDSFELATNPAEVPSLPEPDLSLQQAEMMATNSRCDLAALRWRAEAAESTYHEIWNEKLPWIKEVQAGYEDNSGNASDKYWVGLAVDIPIFSWTKNHADDVALAKAALASVDLTNGIRLIRIDLRDAMDELDEARRQQARDDTSISPLIITMRQTLATLKNTPNIMPEQVAAAELQLVETLRLELETRWQYQLALFNLERIIGAPLSQ